MTDLYLRVLKELNWQIQVNKIVELEKDQKYEVLKSLPAYGPMYIPISENGEEFYSEGLVIRFIKDDGSDWVANFKQAWGIDKVFGFPDENLVLVFAGGNGYLMNPNKEQPLQIIGFVTKEVFQKTTGEIILINDIGIEIFDPATRELWTSERISWDGFKELTFRNGVVTGKSFDPTNSAEEWVDFSFDSVTKEVKGGSFIEALERNPHLEMKNSVEVRREINVAKPWWKLW